MATICDIDDTLLRNGTQPIRRTIDYINSLSGAIIIVTGRPASTRKRTVEALRAAGVKYSRLIMNPGSTRSSNEFKAEVAQRLKGMVNLAIDNDAGARAAYSKAGIPTKDPASLPDIKKFWTLKNNSK
jgi:hydroxymethylpyrimidine pyrophosphatase-like HAD family hydrolase